MDKEMLSTLFRIVSKMKPYEWYRVKHYIDKKYSSKQDNVPMPSLEELEDYSVLDFPNVKNLQSEYDKD